MFVLIKKTLLSILLYVFPNLGDNASILMYHSIGDNKAFFTVSRENFEKQLLYLKKHNFKVIKLSELVSNLATGKPVANYVSLTFDDGYKDNIDLAYPLLKKYDIPATIFVSTNYIGQTMTNSEGFILPMIGEQDMESLKNDELIEFLPHTQTHKNLTDCSLNEITSELDNSVKVIERITGRTVPLILSYPKGKYNQSVINVLQSKNWLGAVTVHPGLVNNKTDHYILPRNAIVSASSFVEFRNKLSRAVKLYCYIRKITQKKFDTTK